jgi:hypothetical protein
VRAILRYILLARKIDSGFFFRKYRNDAFDIDTEPMPHTEFLSIVKNCMNSLGRNPDKYGTHSLRRGGVQYFAFYQNWNVQRIATWAGWSADFNMAVIIRYLQPDEDPQSVRELSLHGSNLLPVRA